MKKINELISNSRFFYFFIAVIILLIFYHYRWGLNLFNPTFINWVIDDVELANVFFSFGYYRYQELGLPIGNVDSYFYPLGTNVYTTDIPLLALLFKPFSPFLPQDFQYIGIWYLVCHLLQAWFAILLCERFGIKGITKLLVVTFLLFPPVLMSRYLHCTLFCQWMILAALWVYFIDPEKTPVRKILFYQLSLFVISGLVFAYIWAMIFGFTVALFLRLWLIDKKLKFFQAAGYFIFYSGLMVSVWLLVGLISIDGIPNYQLPGFGQYSLNLNSVYNPMGTSSLMPTSPYFADQELEGYNYLGLGIIVLAILCLRFYVGGLFSEKRNVITNHFTIASINILPLFLFFIFSTVYALSNTITINKTILFQFEVSGLLSSLTNSFRASGRFFWPPYYFIFIILFYYFNKLNGGFVAKNIILMSCLGLQLYDMQYYFKALPIKYTNYKPPINQVWEKLISSYDNIIFYPGFERSYLSFDDYRYFTYYSVIYKKNINVGYPSRFDGEKANSLSLALENKILNEALDDHTLFITLDSYLNRLVIPLSKNEAYCYNIDGYLAIFTKTRNGEALSKFLEQNIEGDELNKKGLQVTAKPWNTPDDSILTKNVRMGFYKTDDTKDHFYLRGWAFDEESVDILGDSLYLILESATKKRWISPVFRFGTPDVVDYLGGKSELAQTGFGISLVKNNLKNGTYLTGLLFRNQKTNLTSLFWTDYRVSVEKPADLFLIKRPAPKASELQFDIYGIESSGENIRIECWAFPKTGICTSCKSYFTLSSLSSFYGAEAFSVSRPDVVAYFNNPSLINTGLKVTFKKDALAKGSYKLGILQRDTLKQIDYFSETDKLVHIGQDEFTTPEEMRVTPQGMDTIRAFVDGVENKEGFVQIKGWAFINNVSTDFSETSLVLKSEDNLYSFAVTPVHRSDLQDFFKLSYNVDWAGLSVKFKKESMKPGEYQVCIMMLNKKNNTKSLQCLETRIKI